MQLNNPRLRKMSPDDTGNYARAFSLLLQMGVFKRSEAYLVKIAHDNDCPRLSNTGICNCEPDISFRGVIYRFKHNGVIEIAGDEDK